MGSFWFAPSISSNPFEQRTVRTILSGRREANGRELTVYEVWKKTTVRQDRICNCGTGYLTLLDVFLGRSSLLCRPRKCCTNTNIINESSPKAFAARNPEGRPMPTRPRNDSPPRQFCRTVLRQLLSICSRISRRTACHCSAKVSDVRDGRGALQQRERSGLCLKPTFGVRSKFGATVPRRSSV